MVGIAALLTSLQFAYWAVLIYLPLFLRVCDFIDRRRISLVILSAAKDLIARSFKVRSYQAAMRSFAALRTTEKCEVGNGSAGDRKSHTL
jgi:hypothetical protein